MMERPRQVIWPEVGHPIPLVDVEPAPQDVEFRSTSDETPPLGGLLNSAVEAEEQKDVAAADALFVEMSLRDADLAEHT